MIALQKKSRSSKRLFIIGFSIYVFILFLLVLPTKAKAAHGALPFQEGERLVFNVRWGFIKVGEAVMEVLPNKFVDGQTVRHFRLKTRSTSFIDNIYKVRNEFESFTDMAISRSVLYKKKQEEGSSYREVVVKFDWKNSIASYASFGKHENDTEILPGTFDPLGILYYTRTLDYGKIDGFRRPVADGKKCVMGSGTLVGKERIKLNGISYDTYVIEPHMKNIDGLFQENQDVRIMLWFKADHLRIPVKIKIEVLIGSIICELVPSFGTQSSGTGKNSPIQNQKADRPKHRPNATNR